MTESEIIARTVELVEEYSSQSNIAASTSLDDLAMDSLETLALATAIESEFEIQIDDDKILNLSTVGQLVAYVIGQTAPKASPND